MAKRAIQSFVVNSGGRSYSIGTGTIYANTNPVVVAFPGLFADVTERAGSTLSAPTVTAGTPAATTCDVTWTEVAGADTYTVTTDPATSTYVITDGTEEVTLTGLTTATEYDVLVVAGSYNPEVADSTAGTDTFTTA